MPLTLDEIIAETAGKNLTDEERAPLLVKKFENVAELNDAIDKMLKGREGQGSEKTKEQTAQNDDKSKENPAENTDNSPAPSSSGRTGGENAGSPTANGDTAATNEGVEQQKEVKKKSGQELEQDALANNLKKLYGDDVESSSERLDEALTVVNEKGQNGKGEPDSIYTLAKTRLAIKEAEFKQKYGMDPLTGEPLKDKEGKPLEAKDGKFPLDERSEKLLANKDNINDAILRRMEGLSSGKETLPLNDNSTLTMGVLQGKNGFKKVVYVDKGSVQKTATGSFVKTNYSFEVLHSNLPKELVDHCPKTIRKAFRNALVKPQAKQMTRDAKIVEKLNKRMDRLANRSQKMSQYNIKEDDGLVTRFFKNSKRSMREWKYKETDRFNADINSFKTEAKEALWTNNPFVVLGKKVLDNKYRRGFRNWRAKQANRARLAPSRATKWLKGKAEIAKGWLKNKAKSGWNWLKDKSWAGKAIKGVGKAVSWTAGKAVSGVKAIGRGINKYAIQPLVVKPAQFVWRHKKAIALSAAVAGASFMTAGVGGLAIGGAAIAAGYGIKKKLPEIKSAAKGAKQYASDQVTLTKEAVKTKVDNMNVSMLETAVERQGSRNAEMENINSELARIKGEAIYNNDPRAVESVFANYQNNGKPKDDKEAATQLMQMLTSKDKTKGGLGLEPEQVNDLVTYLNQSQLKDGQKPLPTYEEMQKASADTKEQPTQSGENKGKEAENKGQEGQEQAQPESKAEKESKKKPNPMNALSVEDRKQLNNAVAAYHANVKSTHLTEEQAAKGLGAILSKSKEEGGLGLNPEQAQEMKDYLGTMKGINPWKPKKATEAEIKENKSIDRFARKKGLDAQTLKAQRAKTGPEM